jgi:primosomal protein N' (replication factor Y)
MGPRSALFAPLANLGLIVVDECHDTSYYNAEFPPFYNARMAAVTYARLCSAVCLLGSATPDLESRHMAEQGKWELINLPARILAHRAAISRQLSALEKQGSHTPGRFRPLEREAQAADLPPVRLVDMRVELKSGNRSIISRALAQALSETLERGEQAILFLNRRGTATYVFCRDCGYTLKCPHCDIPLAFHTHDHAGSPSAGKPTPLLCHRCNYTRQRPSICPDCRSPHIRQYGLGTERVESEIRQRHPQARVIRWDYDTTRKKDAHEMLFEMFSRHGADILIGTQMIAKGLDLPLVTLVGAILADVGLTLPDLRASERTFQVLTQVAGRAGRSPLGGQAILQTFQPDHYVLQAASEHSYDAFYKAEMAKRKKLDYPPFARLVRLEYRHQDQATAQAAAERLAIDVRTWLAQSGLRQTEIIGPAPCFFSRVAGQYRWQIILRGPNPVIVLRGQNLLEWRVEVDPISLL